MVLLFYVITHTFRTSHVHQIFSTAIAFPMWICPIQHVDLFMFKLGRENMLTQQAMGWNRKKTENLHKALAQRYVTVSSLIKIWWTLFFAGRWHEIVLPFFLCFQDLREGKTGSCQPQWLSAKAKPHSANNRAVGVWCPAMGSHR